MLELIEPYAREDKGQQVFFTSDAVSSLARFESFSLLLSSLALLQINSSLADGSISSRRKLLNTL